MFQTTNQISYISCKWWMKPESQATKIRTKIGPFLQSRRWNPSDIPSRDGNTCQLDMQTVVSTPLKKIVNCDDDIPNIWENKKCSKSPTSIQQYHIFCLILSGSSTIDPITRPFSPYWNVCWSPICWPI